MRTGMKRYGAFGAAVLAALGLAIGGAGSAKAYPDGPIEFIVMWPAGGGADTASRIFTDQLEEVLDEEIVVRNVEGGGGSIGYAAAMDADPDGHTLVTIQGDLPKYEPMDMAPIAIDDFDIIAGFAFQSPMIVVRADSEWDTLEDFIESARANPGEISVGTTDIGGVFHQPLVLFEESADAEFNVVTMEGSPQQTVGLLGGHIDAAVTWVRPNISYEEEGEVRFLGYMASERHSDYPDVPTVSELGYEPVWEHPYGVGAPAGVPDEARDTIQSAAEEIWDRPEFAEELDALGLSVLRLDGEAYHQHMLDMQENMVRVLGLIEEQ